jgi:hypothetical protein
MNVQTQYDLEVAEDTIAARIHREVKPAPRDRKTGELKGILRAKAPLYFGIFSALVKSCPDTRRLGEIGPSHIWQTGQIWGTRDGALTQDGWVRFGGFPPCLLERREETRMGHPGSGRIRSWFSSESTECLAEQREHKVLRLAQDDNG